MRPFRDVRFHHPLIAWQTDDHCHVAAGDGTCQDICRIFFSSSCFLIPHIPLLLTDLILFPPFTETAAKASSETPDQPAVPGNNDDTNRLVWAARHARAEITPTPSAACSRSGCPVCTGYKTAYQCAVLTLRCQHLHGYRGSLLMETRILSPARLRLSAIL